MALGETGQHDFVIRNTGAAPLKLAKGPTQCKCTLTGLKEQDLAPGGEAKIHLEWTPKSLGPFNQSATIWTNDPEHAEISLSVEGEMMSEIVTEPENNWVLGTIQTGQENQFTGAIYSAIYNEFEITGIETSTDRLTVTSQPLTDQEKSEHQALSGYRLRGSIRATDTAGPIRETVTVLTNLEKHPQFEFQVTGNQSGPVLVIAPGWYAGSHLLQLGIIDAQQGKTQKLTLMVEPFDGQLELTEIKATPSFVKVSLQPEENAGNARRRRYSLTLEIPPGIPPGIWLSDKLGKILMQTNHPLQPEMEINLDMEIR
jgi:hypothetical protein